MEAERYIRNGLSPAEQEALGQATVAIIGCGGLGGRCAELLVRLGIGSFLLTDPDTFTDSNLNRQIFCTPQTIGLDKAAVAADALRAINPEVTVECYVQSFDETSIQSADLVIDGLDSGPDRLRLATLCRRRSLPLIHGAVQGWYGQAGVDQGKTPLLNTLYTNVETDATPKVLPMTVALVAAIQATEACKYLLKKHSVLTQGWMQCDLLHTDFDKILQEYP